MCWQDADESPYPPASWDGLQPASRVFHCFNTRDEALLSGLAAGRIAGVPLPEPSRSGFWKLGDVTHSVAFIPRSKSNIVADLMQERLPCVSAMYGAEFIQLLQSFF